MKGPVDESVVASYIADHYGECRLSGRSAADGCLCQNTEWRGRECPNWRPVTARTWAELREEQRSLSQAVTRDTAGAIA